MRRASAESDKHGDFVVDVFSCWFCFSEVRKLRGEGFGGDATEIFMRSDRDPPVCSHYSR